jgi:hypothetical protein
MMRRGSADDEERVCCCSGLCSADSGGEGASGLKNGTTGESGEEIGGKW